MLRHRLVAIVLGVLALGSIVIGAVSLVVVQSQLLQRVDDQLALLLERPAVGAIGGDQPTLLDRPGTGPGALALIVADGVVYQSGYLDRDGSSVALGQPQIGALLGVNERRAPETIDLGGDLGHYRVVATGTESGEAVVGLPLSDQRTTMAFLGGAIGAVILVMLGGAVVASYLAVRLALRPLERVAQAAAEVSELPLSRGEVALGTRLGPRDADDRTEVGRVGAAINRMLGHVGQALAARHASEKKVRRFVSDASHELRTPLASISGYAELAARSGADLPEDVAYSLGRIRAESGRMAAIVEDLLLLARLDEGRELASDPVDLTALAIDALNDAHAAAPDHVFELEATEPIVVRGDRGRLHQVVANLLANARVHTPAGTTVLARLTRATGAGGVEVGRFEVEDDGPGIDEALQAAVFGRFVRGDGSRSRGTGSTGLGLAIVDGVVRAHGGDVALESSPGRTVFRVELPLETEGRLAAGDARGVRST